MTNHYNEYKLDEFRIEYLRLVLCSCGCCDEYQRDEDCFGTELEALEAFADLEERGGCAAIRLYKLNEQGRYELIKEEL